MVSAKGDKIDHFGKAEASFTAVDSTNVVKSMKMGFDVCDVRKALAAVWMICEAGNVVQFGKEKGESFIQNKVSEEKFF